MRFRSAFFGILLIVLILAGCASQEKPPTASNTSFSPPVEVVKTFGINETVSADNVSFKVSAWGFVPNWGHTTPSEKGKLLWVRIALENAGQIPIVLPGNFHISYRGANATPYGLNWHEGEYYNDGKLHNPGVVNEGYLFFDVPEGLNDGESTFFAEMPTGKYKMLLSNGVPVSGEHVSMTDVKLFTVSSQPIGYPVVKKMVMTFNVTNDRHHYSSGLWLQIYKVNGKEFDEGYGHRVMITNGIPFETSTLTIDLPISYNDKNLTYEDMYSRTGKLVLGKPGEKINLTITLDGNSSIQESSFSVELPPLTSDTPHSP